MKVEIQLTPKQLAALAPLFHAVTKAANKSTGFDDQRGAILGQGAMAKKNIALLKRLRTRYLRMRHPKHFNQKVIAAKTECGAAMCSIGHTLDLCGYKMRFNPDMPGFLDFEFIRPSGRVLQEDVHVHAQKLLGLAFDDSCRLFMDKKIKTPKQAAARIAELIEEG